MQQKSSNRGLRLFQRRSRPRVMLGQHPRQHLRGWKGTLNLEAKKPGDYKKSEDEWSKKKRN